eukprot:CAMPEP_0184009520 /NCGR_PEP_ID=MMETSP0954-20121128/2654_1 /TAXON_ID=627963 /ORGANISM="Aplanochytrium sp, Strain PBS07" /LENGTH=430 /DNA_ID=CAMNT_0026288909 /DNA_START=342 /DNA_END=1634 /DNA_ORIENTATION=+
MISDVRLKRTRPGDVVRIGHMTDLEGHLEFFKRSVRLSSVLELREQESSSSSSPSCRLEFIRENDIFVFGGDVCDHGVGDQIIAESLIDFKLRHPERVFLLAGNRDINKMQLTSSVVPYFLENEKVGIEKLKHFLKRKLNCPNAFELRRKALKAVSPGEEVDDLAVTLSFIESVKPGGFMTEYLRLAQLGVVIEDTLYVHGAITEKSVGTVPRTEKVYSNLRKWIQALNEFAEQEVTEWQRSPTEHGKYLINYQMPGGFDGKSVVYANWWKPGSSPFFPRSIPESVAAFLADSNIKNVITGHAPLGDSPTVIRHDLKDITVVACDTSYSDRLAPDKRGEAISEALVVLTAQDGHVESRVRIHGSLCNGQEFDTYVVDSIPFLGRPSKSPPGGWIKLGLGNGNCLVCMVPKNPKHPFEIHQKSVHVSNLAI